MKRKRCEATCAPRAETRISRERRKSFGISQIETMRETFYQMAVILKTYGHQWTKPNIKLYKQTMEILR